MSILAWIILGVAAGAIAKAIYPGRQGGGFISTMLLGLLGALIGGSFVNYLGTGSFRFATPHQLNITSLVYAVLGAMFGIFILNLVNDNRQTP